MEAREDPQASHKDLQYPQADPQEDHPADHPEAHQVNLEQWAWDTRKLSHQGPSSLAWNFTQVNQNTTGWLL